MRNVSSAPSAPSAGGSSSVSINGGVTLNNASVLNSATSALNDVLATLGQGRIFGAVVTGTAAAANKAIAELNNPNASGKVVYVYSIDVFVPTAMAIAVVIGGTTIAPATASIPLRAGGAAGVALVGGSNQLAPTGSQFYLTPSLAVNTDYAIPHDWIIGLPANTNMQLQGQTVNQSFTCNLRWIELNA